MHGQLDENLVPEILREIAEKKLSGLLRVSRGKVIKAIFFDSGTPVHAISNLANEQLDQRIISLGCVTAEQVEETKARQDKAHQFGRCMVEMGFISDETMQNVGRELALDILLSLFEWDQGEYVFDERVRAAHDVVLNRSAEECLLEGARRASKIPNIARALVPPESVVTQPQRNGAATGSYSLSSVESYVLSRLDTPTPASQIGALTGLPDDEAVRTLCVLVAAGLAERIDDHPKRGASSDEASAEPIDDAAEKLREEVSRKLHFFSTADFYEVLEVTRRATSAEIKTAYYQLAKRFHPDRYRQPEHSELRSKLEALFAKVTQAYDTLSDAAQRASYDERLKTKSAGQALASEHIEPIAAHQFRDQRPAEAGEDSLSQNGGLSESVDEQHGTQGPHHQPHQQSPQAAEFYYGQGRARYDQKDYYAAVQLFREAVKLDPTKPQYHFHLGIALVQNPRTRREGEAHLLKAADLDRFSAQIRIRLAMLYKEAGLAKKAEAYFREALSIDPENRTAQRELGGSAKKGASSNTWKSDIKRLFKK